MMVSGHLHEKNGMYYIILNLKDEQGKRKPKWITTGLPVKSNSRRAAELLLKTRMEWDRKLTEQAADKILFADYIEQIWLPSKRGVEATTLAEYTHEVCRIAQYFRARGVTVGKMSVMEIEDYYDILRERLSESSVHKYHTKIHSALRHAVRKGLILANPAASVDKPKPKQYIASFCNADEMQAVLDLFKGTRLELAVMLGFYGLRRSEVIGLKWEAVDFVRNTISINFTVTQCRLNGKPHIDEKPRTKNKSSRRTLPMIPPLRDKLLAMKKVQEEQREQCGQSYNTEHLEFVYLDATGNLTRPDYITLTFKRMIKRHGLRRVRFHDLRHTYATLLACFSNIFRSIFLKTAQKNSNDYTSRTYNCTKIKRVIVQFQHFSPCLTYRGTS